MRMKLFDPAKCYFPGERVYYHGREWTCQKVAIAIIPSYQNDYWI